MTLLTVVLCIVAAILVGFYFQSKKNKQSLANKKNVLFCLMDVSGSMGKEQILSAKNQYERLIASLKPQWGENFKVEYIRYHTKATRCDEYEFYHSMDIGGSLLSYGLTKIQHILECDYPENEWNAYIAHVSDGQNFESDDPDCKLILKDMLRSNVSHILYSEVYSPYSEEDIRHIYANLGDYEDKISIATYNSPLNLDTVFKAA